MEMGYTRKENIHGEGTQINIWSGGIYREGIYIEWEHTRGGHTWRCDSHGERTYTERGHT